ncbi:hypothetical protein BH23ACT3_BH23ACT3_15700 [soil metagenome]
MTALLVHGLAELRRRWQSWLGATMLVALVVGITLAAVSGARRTDTAFDRMLEDTAFWHLMVNPHAGIESELDPQALAALPGVERLGTAHAMGLFVKGPDGQDLPSLAMAAVEPGTFTDHFRPNLLDGRLFDPDRPDEVMLGSRLARQLEVSAGDRFSAALLDLDRYFEWEEGGRTGPLPTSALTLTVAGVGVLADELNADESASFAYILLTPAFWAEHEGESFFYTHVLTLADDVDVAAMRGMISEILPPGESVEFRTIASISEAVGRGTQPHVVALLAFAAVVAGAGSVMCVQVLNRSLGALSVDAVALRALGCGRRLLLCAALGRVGLAAMAGSLLAIGIALATSPLFPIGLAREAEVSRGVDVNVAVLATGALLAVSLAVAGALPTAWRLARGRSTRRVPRAGRWTDRLGSASGRPVLSTGVRLALDPGPEGVPVRSTVLGVGIGIAALAAVLTFAAGLASFADTPSRYGWAWDAYIELADFEGPPQDHPIVTGLLASEVQGVSLGLNDRVDVGGTPVAVVGIDHLRGEVGPPIVAGTRPRGPDEIALGGRTMERLAVGLGDLVAVGQGENERDLRIVGQVVFPGLGTYPGSDRTEPGRGALLTLEAVRELGEGFDFPFVVVDDALDGRVDAAVQEALTGYEESVAVGELDVFLQPQRPADVVHLQQVRATPMMLGAVLAILAAASLTHALSSSIRRRRRDVAVLQVLGLGRRQVIGVVAVQTLTIAVIGLAAGLAIGVPAGRWSWTLLSRRIGVPAEPVVPLSLVVLAVGVLVLVAIVAVLPAIRASRMRPASVLRVE